MQVWEGGDCLEGTAGDGRGQARQAKNWGLLAGTSSFPKLWPAVGVLPPPGRQARAQFGTHWAKGAQPPRGGCLLQLCSCAW